MFEHNHVLPFIFTFLPILVYAMLIYISTPRGSVNPKAGTLYFFMGMISTIIVSAILYMFPKWKILTTNDIILGQFVLAFVQIAFIEELSKFSMFKFLSSFRHENDHPAGVMFYCMCVSAGFAVSENLLYLEMFGSSVLLPRAFTALIIHLIAGIMMGYYVALGRVEGSTSEIGSLSKRQKKWAYGALGVLAATVYHGMYDFNIIINDDLPNMYSVFGVIGLGLMITWWMSGKFFK